MITKEIKNWIYGIVDSIEPNSIPVGSLSSALNFLTLGDRIEQRRGSRTLGADAGAGSVGGLGVGIKLGPDGTEIMFRKRKGQRKIEWWNVDTEAWAETGNDATPVAANDDDFAFDTYQSQAGSQGFFSSPTSSIYKILIANPGSITDLVSSAYRGYIRIKQSRMFLWNRNGTATGQRDEQNPYLSYIDALTYTTVTAEATTSLAGTLVFKAGDPKRTCFGVIITLTGSGEVYTDNRDGTLTGSLGGTGTINYTTGEYTLSAAGVGTADYQWEDSSTEGIADFSFTSPVRVAAEGNVFLQGDGGPLMGVETYGDVEYCLHLYKTYALKLTRDDTDAENLVFRDREGIPHWRAVKGTSRGVFYVNAIEPDNAKLKVMRLQGGSDAVDGDPISDSLDLSPYRFDQCEVNEWGNYITFSCRTADSVSNNRYILYHKDWKSFDIVDFWGVVSAVFGGVFHIGESITGNVVEAFSGFDDDEAVIDANAVINEWDLEYPGILKVVKKVQLEGDIGPDARYDVYASPDKGPFVRIGQISGAGSYVDRSQRVTVGSLTMGRGEVAGGSGEVTAYHYFRELPLRLGRFERVAIKLVRANDEDDEDLEGLGYFSLSTLRFYDIRVRAQKLPRKYRGG